MNIIMNEQSKNILKKMIRDTPALEVCRADIIKAFDIIRDCYKNKGKLLICGNGGSASDSEHIVGELMKGFVLKRPVNTSQRKVLEKAFPDDAGYLANNLQGALPAISLVSQCAITSAFINDVAPDMVYAQQVYGYINKGDVILGLSTSGNSENIINAIKVGKAFGAKIISMTGRDGGQLKDICDVSLISPAQETYRIQEYHLMMYHALCAMIEAAFFKK